MFNPLNMKRLLVVSVGFAIWFTPPPEAVSINAWQLFAVFFATIFSIILGVLPIFTASIIAVSIAVFTGTLTVEEAYEGFSESFILLIVTAFLVAKAVVKSGLGRRIALYMIQIFGRSSLGLGYAMVLTDMLIAPAFPSNTARSGVLFPIVQSLAHQSGSRPEDGSRRVMGSFLMMTSMVGISLSSTLWFTAMAANPIGAAMASEAGIHIDFFDWFLAASAPTLGAFFLIPFLLYKIYPPQKKETPEAPKAAKKELKDMGPISKNEWITAVTFVSMVTLWALSGKIELDKTAVAFAGLAVLMVSHIFTLEDLRGQGSALSTLIWFAILYAMSTSLNEMGFMNYIGDQIASHLGGYSWQTIFVLLIVLYVLIHYLFVSQTAQMLALYGVFLDVGIDVGVPGELLALMLLFATNFNSVITPQGSSANILFAASEYMTSGEMYRIGALVTLMNTLIFLTVGTAWMLLIIS